MRFRHAALAVTAVLISLPAAAQDLPPRKPGLWEMTETTTIQSRISPPLVSQHCIDAATDRAMQAFAAGMIKAKCERMDWRREGQARVLYAGCKAGEQTMSVYGVATGDFATDYTTTLTITRIGRPLWPTMPPQTTITSKARWIGNCKADQRPGDMMLDGKTTSIRDMPGVGDVLPRNETQLPLRKAGLWEIRSAFEGAALPPQTQRQCVNAALDRRMIMFASSDPAERCSQSIERDGDSYLFTGQCVGAVTTLARAAITGDFESALAAQITIRRADGEPLAPGLPGELKVRQEQRRLADCGADMRPGDIVLPDGSRQNVGDPAR